MQKNRGRYDGRVEIYMETRRMPMQCEECRINTRSMKKKKERPAMLFNHVAVDEPPGSTCGATRSLQD